MQNIKALGFVVSEKKIFKKFHPQNLVLACVAYICHELKPFKQFKKGFIRIIPTKFGQNPASSLGGDVL